MTMLLSFLKFLQRNHKKLRQKLSRFVRKDWQYISNNNYCKIMKEEKRKHLEEKGFRIGSATDFLNLTPEEEAYIEIRLEISNLLKSQRTKRNWTQQQLAQAMGSSQSRVAKMEIGDSSTSLDLMIKALLHLGVSKQEIWKLLEDSLEVVG